MDGKESCKGKLEAASISDILYLFGQGNFFFFFFREKSGEVLKVIIYVTLQKESLDLAVKSLQFNYFATYGYMFPLTGNC